MTTTIKHDERLRAAKEKSTYYYRKAANYTGEQGLWDFERRRKDISA